MIFKYFCITAFLSEILNRARAELRKNEVVLRYPYRKSTTDYIKYLSLVQPNYSLHG